MTVWEFACAQAGYNDAHSSGDKQAPEMDDDRLSALGIEGF